MENIFDIELETADFIPYDGDFQTAEIEPAEIITGEMSDENNNNFSACPD